MGFCWWELYWPHRRIQEGRLLKGFNTAMRSFAQRHFLEGDMYIDPALLSPISALFGARVHPHAVANLMNDSVH
jgi:hypothetical protein